MHYKYILNDYWYIYGGESFCGELWPESKQVQTPIMLLCSLSDSYPGERYEPPYPSNYGLNSTSTVLLQGWLLH